MKKSSKILIPLLLVLVILGSIVWYLFVYDRGFTRDALLSQARFNDDNGNHKLASWFYDLAYEFAGQDENIAIELANQYKAAGNYTKAEVTLSNAIADGGTVELYIALCETFVEQDKLLDAVTMLDNVADPVIKAQLEELRPAAPAVSPAPGFYSEYISVSMHSTDCTIYYTINGEYPTTDDAPYSEPILLPAGETRIYAVAVAENGLVSPLALLGYTINGVIEPVTFTDPAMEATVRQLMNFSDDHVIYSNELWEITEFTVPEGVETLTDLALMPYLKSLTIKDMTFENLQFLAPLADLEALTLSHCRFPADNLSVIAGLPSLQRLSLPSCGLSTVAGLSNAHSLTYLDLSNNTIRNLEPLSGMMALAELNLQHNAVTDVTDLGSLSALQKLDVSFNSLTSIAPLASCIKLSWLDASNNTLENLSAATNLAALTHLYAANNGLNNVSALANCPGLIELNISNNNLTDISALNALTSLEVLNFSYNDVYEIPVWPTGSALRMIDGSHNNLSAINNLNNLTKLTHVYMDYNENIKSINSLAQCYCLVVVNVYGTGVSDVSALTEHNIIVNYDPT